MFPAVQELDARAHDEVDNRPGCEYFTVACERVDAGGDVHGDSADVVPAQLDLTGVETSSDLDSQWTQRRS